MLQVAFIRQNVDFVKERLAVRNFPEPKLVDVIVSMDDQRKRLQLESDTIQSRINILSKEIGQLMAKGGKQEAEEKKQEVGTLKAALEPIATELAKVEQELNDTLVRLPYCPTGFVI